jgi:isopentenyldiphosphate isomerase
MTDALIQIVDENDIPIRGGTKFEAQTDGLWHRIVKIVLQDSTGNILLQRRGEHILSPGCWDFSASGHVDEGEDYLDAALRELAEEIGVSGITLHKIDSVKYDKTDKDGRIFRRFAVTYISQIDHDYAFRLEPIEVAEIRWFTLDEAKTLARISPETVTSGLRQIFEGGLVK